MLRFSLAILCTLPTMLLAGERKSKPTSLDGKWEVAEVLINGRKNDAALKGSLSIKGDKLTLMAIGRGKRETSFTLDPKQKPAELDWKLPGLGGKPMTLKAIYKLEKDSLMLAYPLLPDQPRPKSFEATEGDRKIVLKLKRAKPDKPKKSDQPSQ